jgi:hypothetical protein
MRGPIVLADVRLDLDDPADASRDSGGVADEAQADERRGDVERRPAEELPEAAQLDGL